MGLDLREIHLSNVLFASPFFHKSCFMLNSGNIHTISFHQIAAPSFLWEQFFAQLELHSLKRFTFVGPRLDRREDFRAASGHHPLIYILPFLKRHLGVTHLELRFLELPTKPFSSLEIPGFSKLTTLKAHAKLATLLLEEQPKNLQHLDSLYLFSNAPAPSFGPHFYVPYDLNAALSAVRSRINSCPIKLSLDSECTYAFFIWIDVRAEMIRHWKTQCPRKPFRQVNALELIFPLCDGCHIEDDRWLGSLHVTNDKLTEWLQQLFPSLTSLRIFGLTKSFSDVVLNTYSRPEWFTIDHRYIQ